MLIGQERFVETYKVDSKEKFSDEVYSRLMKVVQNTKSVDIEADVGLEGKMIEFSYNSNTNIEENL